MKTLLFKKFIFCSLLPMVAASSWQTPGQDSGQPARPINAPKVPGTYYDALVPDTLDLAERAKLGLHYFTGMMDEVLGYEMYFGGYFKTNPPAMYAHVTSLGACQEKAMEAMCFERLMSGSGLHLEREAKMLDMLAAMLGKDGLQWVHADVSKKPWMKIPEPFVMVHGQGRLMRAMVAWYQYTGDPAWKERVDRMVDGLEKIVVRKEDYAYIPVYGFYHEEYLRSCFTPKGWENTVEPTHEKFGEEGSLFNHQGHIPGVLANWHQLTGNKKALQLSGELVRFYTKPKFWADWKGGEYPGVIGAEHAHWTGHLHGHVNTLRAILEYAIATRDARLMQFVRDGYEWARQQGFARIGHLGDAQGCGCARMIGLAVKLSDAGVGDYWEDVDQYIRNEGSERQFVAEDREYLQSLCQGNPRPPNSPEWSTNNVMDRVMGGFGGQPDKAQFWLCCSTHGNMGLFYAWEGALRYAKGVAKVNLLLNRASPWLDIDSYLPYEGKVVIRNKSAHEAFVRIPLWVDRKALRCSVGGKELPKVWLDDYIRFSSLKPDDQLMIEFPVVETTEKWTVPKITGGPGPDQQVYTCRFRGNTLIEISPPLTAGARDFQERGRKYAVSKAPMIKVKRYVTPLVLQW